MQKNIDISHLSGYQTPARARYFLEYDGHNIDDLRHATSFAKEAELPILVIAGGRNTLLAFDEYPGLVIYNNSQGYKIEQREGINNKKSSDKASFLKEDVRTNGQVDLWDNKSSALREASGTSFKKEVYLKVSSGQPIWQLAEELESKYDITVWHRFLGLPWSIGGAVYGNAGCFGLEIGPYVTSVEILDTKIGEVCTKTGEELNFAYRWSECRNHPEWFILSITCDLSQMIEKYPAPAEDPLAWRSRVQPPWYSCGSFFKNPSREQTAGYLIEEVGLKWYRHGGAFFANQHANFLMSDGTATWRDLVELVELAQQKVLQKFQIQLEPEVRIIQHINAKFKMQNS